MSTAVALLHPQDCLDLGRRRKNPRSARRKQQSRDTPSSSSESESVKPPAKNLVLGQVRILKRGEKLVTEENPEISSRSRLGPEPSKFAERFAGSGFVVSPPPSSVPIPAFLREDMLLDFCGPMDGLSRGHGAYSVQIPMKFMNPAIK